MTCMRQWTVFTEGFPIIRGLVIHSGTNLLCLALDLKLDFGHILRAERGSRFGFKRPKRCIVGCFKFFKLLFVLC